MRRGQASARLVALCAFGGVLLSFPLMSVFNLPRLVLGVPVLYVYLFAVWTALIATSACILRSPRR